MSQEATPANKGSEAACEREARRDKLVEAFVNAVFDAQLPPYAKRRFEIMGRATIRISVDQAYDELVLSTWRHDTSLQDSSKVHPVGPHRHRVVGYGSGGDFINASVIYGADDQTRVRTSFGYSGAIRIAEQEGEAVAPDFEEEVRLARELFTEIGILPPVAPSAPVQDWLPPGQREPL